MPAQSVFSHQQVKVGDVSLHIAEAGADSKEAIVFLHGWPQDWSEFRRVMELAAPTYHVVAVDLPGVGHSKGGQVGGEKTVVAELIQQATKKLGLQNYTIVGHDAGAMVAYTYLKNYSQELRGVVLMNSAIPGVEPWSKIAASSYVWHFQFHNIPELPEVLVGGRQRKYFDYFFDLLTKNPAAIGDDARDHYASEYESREALSAGFGWYRAFAKDAEVNSKDISPVNTPVLY